MASHKPVNGVDENLASIDVVTDLGRLVNDIYRKEKHPPVYFVDEARCEYSKDKDLYNVKGVGAALCVAFEKKVKLVEWRGLVSYKNGVKAHWHKLFEDFTPLLLGDYTYGCETYVCPFAHEFVVCELERMKADGGLLLEGCDKESTRSRIDETIDGIIECEDIYKFRKVHGKKDRAGEIAKSKIKAVDEAVIRRVAETRMLYDIRFNSYLRH